MPFLTKAYLPAIFKNKKKLIQLFAAIPANAILIKHRKAVPYFLLKRSTGISGIPKRILYPY